MNIITLETNELPISPNYNDIVYECKNLEDIDFMVQSSVKFPVCGKINNDDLGLHDVNIKLFEDKQFTIDTDISYDFNIVCNDINLSTIDLSHCILY